MRLNDLSAGSIKTLLILGLLFANIALAIPRPGAGSLLGSARDSCAAFGDSPNARATSDAEKQGKTGGQSRALPNSLQP